MTKINLSSITMFHKFTCSIKVNGVNMQMVCINPKDDGIHFIGFVDDEFVYENGRTCKKVLYGIVETLEI